MAVEAKAFYRSVALHSDSQLLATIAVHRRTWLRGALCHACCVLCAVCLDSTRTSTAYISFIERILFFPYCPRSTQGEPATARNVKKVGARARDGVRPTGHGAASSSRKNSRKRKPKQHPAPVATKATPTSTGTSKPAQGNGNWLDIPKRAISSDVDDHGGGGSSNDDFHVVYLIGETKSHSKISRPGSAPAHLHSHRGAGAISRAFSRVGSAVVRRADNVGVTYNKWFVSLECLHQSHDLSVCINHVTSQVFFNHVTRLNFS